MFENKIITDSLFTIVFVGHNSHSTGFIDRFNLLKSKYPQNIFYFESLDLFDLINFYNSARVFLYPSKCEGFGIPPLEAAVLKTPVICSNLTAMMDFDFFQPLMFNPYNENIINIYNYFELNENLIDYKNIRNQIIQKYDWNNSANLLINYFNNSKKLKLVVSKIAIIGTVGLPAKYGGFETLVEYVTKDLNKNFDITVYCSAKSYSNKIKTYNSCRLHYINLEANGMQSMLYDIRSIFHALKYADVLLILGVSGCVILPLIKLFSKKKIVVNIDGLEWKRQKWNGFAKWFLKLSERFARSLLIKSILKFI